MPDALTGRPTRVLLPAVVISSLALAGCGGSSGTTSPTTSPSPTVQPIPSSTVSVPAGVAITPPGTDLAFGDTASVTFESGSAGTVLDLTVDSAKQGTLKDFAGFDLKDSTKRLANYYYVRVTVANNGTETFGGTDVPLWGISGTNTLLPAVRFTAAFAPCPTESLPKKFAPGDEFSTCLVFLAPDHGTLEGVSYRPEVDYDPIEWRGDIKAPKPKPSKGGKSGGGKGGKSGGKKN